MITDFIRNLITSIMNLGNGVSGTTFSLIADMKDVNTSSMSSVAQTIGIPVVVVSMISFIIKAYLGILINLGIYIYKIKENLNGLKD